mmetsp:Transcript_5567/g.13240  ORF Transcript_5567/g.13240 Transcript_5567/m.13240 type:complete len:83 (-) Transcript_5567:883-1131(-)
MPKSLAMLLDLINLDLSYNELTGGDDISFIKDLPHLEELHLKRNFFSGKVGQFGGSSSLRVIDPKNVFVTDSIQFVLWWILY